MSRKRSKNKRPEQAVPEEVLAEGSGPNEVVDANPQSLAAAAEGLVEKRKGKRRKGKVDEAPDEPAYDASAGNVLAETADEEEAALAEAEAAADEDAILRAEAEADLGPVESGSSESAKDAPLGVEAKGDVTGRASKRSRRRGKADVAEAAADMAEAAADMAEAAADEASVERAIQRAEAEAELGAAESPEDAALRAEAEAGSTEAQIEGAVEDAVLRAEAEAELGSPEEPGAGAEPDEELGAALPTTAATMDAAQLKNLVEALVFAADKPVTLQRLRQLTRVSDIKRLEQALADLATEYVNRGIALQQVSGGYQFRTNTQYSVWVQQLIAGRPVRLSRAQLETLAIVAYRQPITRPEIDEIRGVDSSATLRLLLDRALIRTLGKKEDVGRPMLYGTTKEFLDFFSLGDLRELPTLREYSELTAESRKVMSDRLGVDAGAEGGEAIEDADAPAEAAPPPEPTTDDVLAAYVADGDSDSDDDSTAAADAVAAVDASARPAIEVDAWGQVIGVPDEEPPESVEASGVDEEPSENREASGSDDEVVGGAEASGSDDEPSEKLQASGSDDEPGGAPGASGSDDESARLEASGSDDESVGAPEASGPADEPSKDLGASGSDDEPLEALEALEVSGSDDGPSPHLEASGSHESSRDHDLGAPAGGSIEDRIGLSSDIPSDVEDRVEDLEASGSGDAGGDDEESIGSVPDEDDAELSGDDESSQS